MCLFLTETETENHMIITDYFVEKKMKVLEKLHPSVQVSLFEVSLPSFLTPVETLTVMFPLTSCYI